MNKDIYSEIIQNCDCLGYIRAHDSSFNPRYLDVVRRLPHFSKLEDRQEQLNRILDSNKLFLMSIGDSPDKDYKPFSEKYKQREGEFGGRMSLEDKRNYETNPQCFTMLNNKMNEFEDLQYWKSILD